MQELQQTLSQMVFLKKDIFDCFVVDSSHLHLTFEALYLYTPLPPPPKKKKKKLLQLGLKWEKTAGYAPVKVVRAFHNFSQVS